MQIDQPLPLNPVDSRLPLEEPFTPAMARRVGVARSTLERMLREGLLRRLLRGVYVDACVPDSRRLRGAALALVVPPGATVVDRSAGWVHGVEVLRAGAASALPPLEVVGRASAGRGHHFGHERTLLERDVAPVAGVPVTTPLRTALDLGRLLAPDRALAAMDALLRTGEFTHVELLGELGRFRQLRGVVQLRSLAPIVDSRAADTAESFLRLRWLDASLPTPVPGLRVRTAATNPERLCRLALALETQRFAASLAGQLDDGERAFLAAQGWRVVVLSRERVVGSDPYLVMRHLEREFHQQLLRNVS